MDMKAMPIFPDDMRSTWNSFAAYAAENLILTHFVFSAIFLSFRVLVRSFAELQFFIFCPPI
jgi:hypothetical protein